MIGMERKTIVVYGASSAQAEQVFRDAAYRLGGLIAKSGKRLVTGAGSTGLMAAVEEGALDAGGDAIGIIPRFMVDNGWLEIITWKMLGLFVKPIVILNTDHYYDPLLQMLDRTAERNFMNPIFRKLWSVAMTPEEALSLVDSIPDWTDMTSKINKDK